MSGLTLEKLRAVKRELDEYDRLNKPEPFLVFWRRPRSKKRRILKKWMGDVRNYRLMWLNTRKNGETIH